MIVCLFFSKLCCKIDTNLAKRITVVWQNDSHPSCQTFALKYVKLKQQKVNKKNLDVLKRVKTRAAVSIIPVWDLLQVGWILGQEEPVL